MEYLRRYSTANAPKCSNGTTTPWARLPCLHLVEIKVWEKRSACPNRASICYILDPNLFCVMIEQDGGISLCRVNGEPPHPITIITHVPGVIWLVGSISGHYFVTVRAVK